MLDGLPTDATEVERSPRNAPSVAQPSSPAVRGAGEDGPTVTGGPVQGWAEPLVTPRVIGLDLSLTGTGIAYADGETGVVKTAPIERDYRLLHIEKAILVALRPWRCTPPDLAVLEDLPTHAKAAGITGMVHGIARRALMVAEVPYVLIPPATLKKYATGRGNATKPDMRVALLQRAGIDERDDNRVDAWWLRAMGLDHLGRPPVTVTKNQREALTKVAWPQIGTTP